VNGSLGYDVQKLSAFILQLIKKGGWICIMRKWWGLLSTELYLIKPLTYFIGWLPEYICW